jgi:phospholipid/cholesterol/gamma-HCH transport system substrate-binding protein
VQIAGVNIGRVKGIKLEDYQARVKLQIDAAVTIQDDAIAAIKTKGLIGEKFIEISPGGSDSVIANEGKIQETQSPFDLERAISKFLFGKVSD